MVKVMSKDKDVTEVGGWKCIVLQRMEIRKKKSKS